MRSLVRLAATLALLAAALLPQGCARRESAVEASLRTQTLVLGNGADPADMDPHTVTAFTDMNIMVALFEGLTVLDEASSAPLPGRAASWATSPDGLTWTFKLRDDATWSNGDPLTAEDFVYSFRRVLSPGLASEYAYMLWPLRGAKDLSEGREKDPAKLGARALDAHTLELTLEAPCPWLLTLVSNQAWFPVHRATIEKFGRTDERGTRWTRPENLVCNGPFTLSEWSPGARVVVAANPRYKDPARSALRKVVFLPNESLSADELAFRNGQQHATYDLSPEKLDAYRRNAPALLRVDPFYETFFIRLNTAKPPLSDARVRRALALSIDRRALCSGVLRDSRVPAFSLVPPGAGYVSENRIQEDAVLARALLEEAGFPGGKGFPRLEVQLKGDDIHRSVMEALQQMWKTQLGIEVALAPLEQKTWLANQASTDYHLTTSRWIGDFLDANTFLDLFLSTGGKNQTNWKNGEYDALVNQAASTADDKARHAAQAKAEQRLTEEMPIIPIFHGTRTYLLDARVVNWPPSLLGLRRYQYVRLENK